VVVRPGNTSQRTTRSLDRALRKLQTAIYLALQDRLAPEALAKPIKRNREPDGSSSDGAPP